MQRLFFGHLVSRPILLCDLHLQNYVCFKCEHHLYFCINLTVNCRLNGSGSSSYYTEHLHNSWEQADSIGFSAHQSHGSSACPKAQIVSQTTTPCVVCFCASNMHKSCYSSILLFDASVNLGSIEYKKGIVCSFIIRDSKLMQFMYLIFAFILLKVSYGKIMEIPIQGAFSLAPQLQFKEVSYSHAASWSSCAAHCLESRKVCVGMNFHESICSSFLDHGKLIALSVMRRHL